MASLRIGTALVDITPSLGIHIPGYFNDRIAQDIADPLHARAIVFEAGGQAVALVVCDVICLVEEHTKQAKARAAELTGIPPENMMISATHTHYGPATITIFGVEQDDSYCEWMAERIADAIRLAQLNLQAVVIGHGAGSEPNEVHNRRWHMKDGSVRTNPGYLNADLLRPAGPTDPEVGLLAAMTADGRPAAAIMNYALHYVGGPYSNSISADYFGYACQALPRMWGQDFLAVLANGCCGDINNCDFTRPAPTYPDPFYQARRVGNVVAAEAFKVWNQIRDWRDDAVLAAANAYPIFRRRTVTDEQRARMEELLNGPRDPSNREWMFALEHSRVDAKPLEWPIQIQALRVGDVAIVGLPGEVFVEIGLAIKQRSPFPRTLVLELANDWVGYIPTDKAFEEGGYETELGTHSMAAPGTEGQWVETALGLLRQLAG
jgi:hypothetical protein